MIEKLGEKSIETRVFEIHFLARWRHCHIPKMDFDTAEELHLFLQFIDLP
jgi:hypothetical protein